MPLNNIQQLQYSITETSETK